MDIAFNIDNNYIDKCKAVIKSILANTKEPCNFHIIGANIEGYNCYKSPDISEFKGIKQTGHISISAGYRLFLPDILDVDKCIYLDCDLIVLDDLKKLWDYDVKLIAGVQDPLSKHHARKNNLTHTYINSGVLLMNLKELRKINYKDKLKQTQKGYNLSLPDQDMLNIAFDEDIELLDEKWNVYSKIYAETTEKMVIARENPSIIHWCGSKKPFNAKVWRGEEYTKYLYEKSKSKKAIVLTYPNLTKKEEKLLKDTKIFKIACNWHAEGLKPDLRLVLDNKDTIKKALSVGKQKIISANYNYDDERVEKVDYLPNRHSTLISCLDYLYLKGYDNVLLIANNLVTNGNKIASKFQDLNREGVNSLKSCMYIYKYSSEGVFDVPTLTIEEFLNMNEEVMPLTQEDKLLGRTEPRKKTLLEKLALSNAYKYEIHTEGKDNFSIESGEILNNILPREKKQEILEGKEEIHHEGLIIRRLTGIETETKLDTPDFDNMPYYELLAYAKANNIKCKSNKKADVLKAVKGE